MRKISFLGNKSYARKSLFALHRCYDGKHDDGSILGLTVLVLLFFVVATGLMLRASYAEYRKVHEELEELSSVISVERFPYETC